MIQKHEAIEMFIKIINNKSFNSNITNIFSENLNKFRGATAIFLCDSDDMIDKAIEKKSLCKGEYCPIHKDVFFSYSIIGVSEITGENTMCEIGIFALEQPQVNISMFERGQKIIRWFIVGKINNVILSYPMYMDMQLNGYHRLTYDRKIESTGMLKYLENDLASYCSHIIYFSRILSCKNITYVDHEPPEKLNKKRIKHGKEPIYAYKTLEVQLNPKYRKGESTGEKLDTMPLHICQGHFKEYTAEKPLFGSIVGRYWWQPHMRGKAENGVVEKDYLVTQK